MEIVIAVAGAVVGAVILSLLWMAVYRRRAQVQIEEAEGHARRLVDDARKSAEARVKEAELEAKERLIQSRAEFEKESRSTREELKAEERRLQ